MPWQQVQISHTQHIPSQDDWEATVCSLLSSLDPPGKPGEAGPSFLNPQEASMAREEFAKGGQGSLDDLLDALDGGLQVSSLQMWGMRCVVSYAACYDGCVWMYECVLAAMHLHAQMGEKSIRCSSHLRGLTCCRNHREIAPSLL